MILHGIEVTKFKWNDKEVSEEEYCRLNEEWKRSLESQEPSEKNFGSNDTPPKKNSRNKGSKK